MKKALVIIALCTFAGTANAKWCHKTTGGIELCDTVPSSWGECGTFKDGASIYCPPSGKKKSHAKKDKDSYMVLASVGVGLVFIGAMYYFFKKKPSENNPGQVTLASF